MLVSAGERLLPLACFAEMSVRTRSLDDRQYYRDREEQCRKAAAEATDPSARIAHSQLAEFYAQRLAQAEDKAAKG